MLKPLQLRDYLTARVPVLKTSPEQLRVFIDHARIVSTLATSLSFEYQYQLNLLITDFTQDADLLIVPTLAWLREHQPDIMATAAKQQEGFTFRADMNNDNSFDISINLQLTEMVIVKQEGGALRVTHRPEPLLPADIDRPRELYLQGKLVSAWDE
ncbi:phage tail protein [Ewingella sp. S1.OA.A_B6]